MDNFLEGPPGRQETAGMVDELEGDVDAETQKLPLEDDESADSGSTPDDAAGESGDPGS